MITKEKLLELGFQKDSLQDQLYLKTLDPDIIECVFDGDYIIVEVDLEDQIVNFIYYNENEKMFVDDIAHIFFHKIKTNKQLEKFLNIIS